MKWGARVLLDFKGTVRQNGRFGLEWLGKFCGMENLYGVRGTPFKQRQHTGLFNKKWIEACLLKLSHKIETDSTDLAL